MAVSARINEVVLDRDTSRQQWQEKLRVAPSTEFSRLLFALSQQYERDLAEARSSAKDHSAQNQASTHQSLSSQSPSLEMRAPSLEMQDLGTTSEEVQDQHPAAHEEPLEPAEEEEEHDESYGLAHWEHKQKEAEELANSVEVVTKEATAGEEEKVRETPMERLRHFLQSHKCDSLVAAVLLLNIVVLAADVQLTGWRVGYTLTFYSTVFPSDESWPGVETAMKVVDRIFTAFFAAEIAIRMSVLRMEFCKAALNWVDATVVAITLLELAISMDGLPISPVFFRLLRLVKVARAFRMLSLSANLDCLSLLLKCCLSGASVLGWATVLLCLFQGISGMIISTLVQEYLQDETQDFQARKEVFAYWGTFTRTLLTMFEVLFANWAPSCRVLVDNVSEWFSAFFLVYRCMIGVALINVVNSVFISQTLQIAQSDEAFLIRKQQKDQSNLKKKLEALFLKADTSGDGLLSIDEFLNLLENPQLRLWLNQLQLEHYDLVELFAMVDDGDGHVDYTEFVEGATRLRGGARAVDLFRLETKVDLTLRKLNDAKVNRSSAARMVDRLSVARAVEQKDAESPSRKSRFSMFG